MDYLIISDTHRRSFKIKELMNRQVTSVQGVFYLGDGYADAIDLLTDLPFPVYAVKGNCDLGCDELEERLVTVGPYKILLTHGHLYGAKYGTERLMTRANSVGADIVLFGHTHRPHEKTVSVFGKNVVLFNPGALGESPFSFGTLHIDGDKLFFGHGTLT